jgi:hypothetical protein
MTKLLVMAVYAASERQKPAALPAKKISLISSLCDPRLTRFSF